MVDIEYTNLAVTVSWVNILLMGDTWCGVFDAQLKQNGLLKHLKYYKGLSTMPSSRGRY